MYLYNSYFNPLDMLAAANGLARNAYKYGCVIEHGKNCEEKSSEYYNKLNSIKRLK